MFLLMIGLILLCVSSCFDWNLLRMSLSNIETSRLKSSPSYIYYSMGLSYRWSPISTSCSRLGFMDVMM